MLAYPWPPAFRYTCFRVRNKDSGNAGVSPKLTVFTGPAAYVTLLRNKTLKTDGRKRPSRYSPELLPGPFETHPEHGKSSTTICFAAHEFVRRVAAQTGRAPKVIVRARIIIGSPPLPAPTMYKILRRDFRPKHRRRTGENRSELKCEAERRAKQRARGSDSWTEERN